MADVFALTPEHTRLVGRHNAAGAAPRLIANILLCELSVIFFLPVVLKIVINFRYLAINNEAAL